MRIFKTRLFARWARAVKLSDRLLSHAVMEMEQGLIDADLGGHVYKKRIALEGRGKRGGTRSIIAYMVTKKAFFIFGFAKNERGNMKSKSLTEVIHETAKDMHKAGVMKDQTMREFDAMCLPPIKHYTPTQIRRIRIHNKASQAVFAAYLNTSTSTIQKWEQGQKKPSGLALKLLNLIDKHGLILLAA